MKPDLIKEIWSLWDSLAECGELRIGPKFSAQYDRLKIEMEAEEIEQQERAVRSRANHKRWRDKKENKAKISKYNKAYKLNKDMERRKSEALMLQ